MKTLRALFFLSLLALVGCAGNQAIVNNIDERDANEIVVFLASKGIDAQKVSASAGAVPGVGAATTTQFNISVESDRSTEAMALLNRYGLPRRKGPTLLELFAPSGLMTSSLEETIRYQAGLAEELRNTIRKIDGVLDADVNISFNPEAATAAPGAVVPKLTAAVYIKHQGVLEDPNSHLETKIKRLISGSVSGLEYDNVSVISDRSRIADIRLDSSPEMISGKNYQQTYLSIWGVVMTKGSLARFRFLFFSLMILVLLLAGALGWMLYKFYPHLIAKKPSGEGTAPP